MDINGVWRGEYIIIKHMMSTGKEIPVPFFLKIKTTTESGLVGLHRGLFEGVCQDDPELTKITEHANIYGSLDLNSVFFIKQYPKLLIRTASGDVESFDDTHPEVQYRGEFKKDVFSGSWNMHRTFRTVKGQLSELFPMHGTWWMKKM